MMYPRQFLIAGLILLTAAACKNQYNPGRSEKGSGEITQEGGRKAQRAMASLDTNRILQTLALYRAKRYESVDVALENPEQVYKLVLYGKKLGSIPPEIGQLTYLQSLDVAFNELTELPKEIGDLKYLVGFYANGNQLTEIPDFLFDLPILDRVDFSENKIRRIPSSIMNAPNLSSLKMDHNELEELPLELYNMVKIHQLRLEGNNIKEISPAIANLKNLKKLMLGRNQLTDLPDEITYLQIDELEIHQNQIPMERVRELMEAMPGTKFRY